jgi:hypothetical protein
MRLIIAGSVLVILATSPSAQGQGWIEFDFGVRAGVPFTVPFESRLTGPASTFSSQAFSRPAVSVGPTVAAVPYPCGETLTSMRSKIHRRGPLDQHPLLYRRQIGN